MININSFHENLNDVCNRLEIIFNIGACVPVFGTDIILIRLGFAGIQTIAAGSFLAIATLKKNHSDADKDFWKSIRVIGEEHLIQGLLNLCQGVKQLIIGFLFSNLGNLIGPSLRNWKFSPDLPYQHTKEFEMRQEEERRKQRSLQQNSYHAKYHHVY